MLNCFFQTAWGEGVPKLWSGFVPAYLKLALYTIILLLLTDKITKILTAKDAL